MASFIDKMNTYLQTVVPMQDNSEGSAIGEQIGYYHNFLMANPHVKRIVEIGFNVGLSAAAFLASRDDIEVISFDIGIHDYVVKIKKVLDKQFPGRHTLVIGDSKDALPLLNRFFDVSKTPVDVFFVDGDHRAPMPLIDIKNALNWLGPQGTLIVDDICEAHGGEGVNQAIEQCLNEGLITKIEILQCRDRGWGVFKKSSNA